MTQESSKQSSPKTVIATGSGTPTETLKTAQIALINKNSWAVFAPYRRATGLMARVPFPLVDCPVVLTTEIPSGTLRRLVSDHVQISGVDDVDGFIQDLQDYGGIVSHPTEISTELFS
jgi:hypothetical protein